MKNKYLIAVVGTQNTGKTTFIKDLMDYYSNNSLFHPFSTNTVDYRKKIEDEGLEINRNGNLRCQKIIFNCLAQSVFEAVMDDNVTNFVSDRSVIDAYVYTKYLYFHKPELGITQDDLDCMYEKLKKIVKLYDQIIYIPLKECGDVKVVDDKFRDTDLEYRRTIDELFNSVLMDLNLRVENRIHGNRNERLMRFLNLYQSDICQKKLS